jgi:hypothetical protein
MAEIWGAALIAGGAIVSAGAGAASARSASRAAQRGADAATGEQARQYDQTRADYAPYRSVGAGALGQLASLYGIGMPETKGDPDWTAYLRDNPDVAQNTFFASNPEEHYYRHGRAEGRALPSTGGTAAVPGGAPNTNAFFESPDYQFNLAQGQQAIDRSLAAQGRSLSGAGVKEGIRYASGMASNEFGNFYNRLANLAGIGQTATGSTAAAGANAANNISQNHMFAGQARANGYMQTGAAVNNAVQGGMSNYMLSRYLQQPGTGGAGYSGGNTNGNWNGPRP